MVEWRANSLCFNYDEFFKPKYVCNPVLLYIMPIMDGDDQKDVSFKEENLVEYVGGNGEAVRDIPKVGDWGQASNLGKE